MALARSPAELALKERARLLAEAIAVHEERCEVENGLPPEILDELKERTLELGLQAINMPADWGGAGLSISEQVLVQEELERLYRHLRVDRIWEGTSEIQRLIVANEIRKRGLDGLLVPFAGA